MSVCVLAAAVLVLVGSPAGASTRSGRYLVQRGDTLSAIASRLGVSVNRLVASNHLGNPDLVQAGIWLTVPGGSGSSSGSGSSGGSGGSGGGTYTVKPGENLSSIAARFGLATVTLADANGIHDPDQIRAGTRLTIPSVSGGSGYSGSASSSSGSVSGSSSLPLRLRQSPTRLAYIPVFRQWAATYGVPADLLMATTWLESGWQMGVVSSTGAIGIGQLMPITVHTVNRLMGTSLSPWVPTQNIRMSARYMAMLLAATGGNSSRALAGYYQGLASVQRNGLYPSTIAYVDGVQALRRRFD